MAHTPRSWWRRWLNQFTSVGRRPRSSRSPWRQRLFLEALEERWLLSADYVVTSAADSGAGTLRDAITQVEANNPAYTNTIDFNIAGSGVHTINLLSALPGITNNGAGFITINGLTQTGSSKTALMIQLNGASAGAGVNGLDVKSGADPDIEGLIISGFSNDGILIESGGDQTFVFNCWIGTNASGTAVQGNGGAGVEVAANSCEIGTGPGFGNVISGNGFATGLGGIYINFGATFNNVWSNYIGTNAAGTAALGNGPTGDGIDCDGDNNLIGDALSGYGNVLSGNGDTGLYLPGSGNTVVGNSIGTNAAGTVALGNGYNGITVDGTANTIGGTTSAARNIISGNVSDGVAQEFGSGDGSDGIYFRSGATANLVQGNYIGTNAAGTGALGNGSNGIEVTNALNTIGGTTTGAGNVLSGNDSNGVLLDSGAVDTVLQGNFVGVNAAGTSALGNGSNGVEVASSFNTIGGTTTSARNVISGNGNDGILFDSGAAGNKVQGNYLGLSAPGSAALANNGNGVEVAGNNNTIGGYLAGTRNVISGNAADGVLIDPDTSGTVVVGNYLGTNTAGTGALANSGNGVEVLGSSNTVGGASVAARNVLSGNVQDGVLLGIAAFGNQVQGNFIGTAGTGTSAVANSGNGVEVFGSNNTIGGTTPAASNLISGNGNDGVLLDGGATNNQVQGNSIGIAVGGTIGVANGGNGVEVFGSNNTVGGSTAAARNVISGNGNDGVLLDSDASGVAVQGNYIGTNYKATLAVANSGNGVEVAGSDNTVGGLTAGARNVISGNGQDGVLIESSGVAVQGNYIGTDNTGTFKLGNSGSGVEISANGVVLGGTSAAARNVISGNAQAGVLIDSGVSGVTVLGNFIGTKVNGTVALANAVGVEVGGTGNTIGGTSTAARNIISGNSGSGVQIDSGASGNAVQGNYIGVNLSASAAVANGGYGVSIGSSNNTVGGSVSGAGNTIADNSLGGVLVSAGSGNGWHRNAIFANGGGHTGPGIVLASGTNNGLAAPTLSTSVHSGTTVTVTGTFTAPTANVPYLLEFYANPAGDAEGKIEIGKLTVTPTTTGAVSFTFTVTTSVTGTNPLITATVTDVSKDSSAFSNGVTTT